MAEGVRLGPGCEGLTVDGLVRTYYTNIVRDDGVDHIWHSTHFYPGRHQVTTARCGLKLTKPTLRGMVREEELRLCLECRDLPEFFPS